MPEITQDDLKAWFKVQREIAADRVRTYAAHECRLVPAAEIETVCGALGEIGVTEAFDALDRRQRELAGREVPPG
jgi:hypothetical protein